MAAIDPAGASYEAWGKWKRVLRKLGKRRTLEIVIPPVVDELRRVSAADDHHHAGFVEKWEHLAYLPLPTVRAREVIEVLEQMQAGRDRTDLEELVDVWEGYFRGVRHENELPFNIAPWLLRSALAAASFWTPIINPALRLLHAQNPAAGLATMRALCDAAGFSLDDWFQSGG
jgi:hypothetical protein